MKTTLDDLTDYERLVLRKALDAYAVADVTRRDKCEQSIVKAEQVIAHDLSLRLT